VRLIVATQATSVVALQGGRTCNDTDVLGVPLSSGRHCVPPPPHLACDLSRGHGGRERAAQWYSLSGMVDPRARTRRPSLRRRACGGQQPGFRDAWKVWV
jgi:hypothetical protein